MSSAGSPPDGPPAQPLADLVAYVAEDGRRRLGVGGAARRGLEAPRDASSDAPVKTGQVLHASTQKPSRRSSTPSLRMPTFVSRASSPGRLARVVREVRTSSMVATS
jgi:hypothetical protein